MAVYAIGDLQGCLDPLQRLLQRIDFDAGRDRLWLVGDLVSRGPQSLQTLRWACRHRDSLVCVLGNHDLHLLARAAGHRSGSDGDDQLDSILAAPDRNDLLGWLRTLPLAHFDPELDALLVHAGVPPGWDVPTVLREAAHVQSALAGEGWAQLLRGMYGDRPNRWSDSLSGSSRLRFTINALTRMRLCRPDGSLDLVCKGPPESAPAGLVPWFDHPRAAWGRTRVIAGHWSALGWQCRDNLLTLDTGCVWGRALTAARLDAREIAPIAVECEPGGH